MLLFLTIFKTVITENKLSVGGYRITSTMLNPHLMTENKMLHPWNNHCCNLLSVGLINVRENLWRRDGKAIHVVHTHQWWYVSDTYIFAALIYGWVCGKRGIEQSLFLFNWWLWYTNVAIIYNFIRSFYRVLHNRMANLSVVSWVCINWAIKALLKNWIELKIWWTEWSNPAIFDGDEQGSLSEDNIDFSSNKQGLVFTHSTYMALIMRR